MSARHSVARDRIRACVEALASDTGGLGGLRQRNELGREIAEAEQEEKRSRSLGSTRSDRKRRKKRQQLMQQQQQQQQQQQLPQAVSHSTLFGLSVSQFVQCTEESREKDPAVVMRNMRQFMSGMKNYLVRNGEGDLQAIIDEERGKVRR